MDLSDSFDELSVEEKKETKMASHSDILASNNQNTTCDLENKDKNENQIFVQTLESLVNFPDSQKEKENSRFAVSMEDQKDIGHLQTEIAKRTGIKPEDQTMLATNSDGKVVKCKELETGAGNNQMIVYDHGKYLCVKIVPTDSPKIMLVQFKKIATITHLRTYLAEWGLTENNEKIMMKEEGDMESLEPEKLIEELLPTDSDELFSITFECSTSKEGKGILPKKKEAIVLNYKGQPHNKQKIEKATQILSVAFECHPSAKKIFQRRMKVKDGQFWNKQGEINEEEDMECLRKIIAELTGNDQFIELVQEKVVWEHKFDEWTDTPTFKTLVKSLFLDTPNIELVHKSYTTKSNKKFPIWTSQDQDIENYQNSLPNIQMTRNNYESHLHTDFLCNIERISGKDMINYCRMGLVLPGDAIYIFHRRPLLGDYAHVMLYTGLQKSATDQVPDHPTVKATKDKLHCVHLQAVEISKIIFNVFEDATTIVCETLNKAIPDKAECFVVRMAEDEETRSKFVRRAFQLTESPFTFDYDAKGGNCESVISAIWEQWDNLSPQGETISNPDGHTRQKMFSKLLETANPHSSGSLVVKLRNRL